MRLPNYYYILLFLIFSFSTTFSQNWSPDLNEKQQQIQDFFNTLATKENSRPPNAPQKGSRLQIHLPFEPAHLNPISSGDPNSELIHSLIGDTLLLKNVQEQYIPSLCQSYVVEDLVLLKKQGSTNYLSDKVFGKVTPIENGIQIKPISRGNPLYRTKQFSSQDILQIYRDCVFTFYLKPGVSWHDGSPFTAEDLKFSFQKLKSKFVSCDALRRAYEDLKFCSEVSTNQIRFIFEKENGFALDLMANFPIVAKKVYFNPKLTEEKQGKEFNKTSAANRLFNGLGPYKIKEWKAGLFLHLIRNPKYYNPSQGGYFEEIIIRFISDPQKAYQHFQEGKLDALLDLPPGMALLAEHNPLITRGTHYLRGFTGIGWNLNHFAFQDRRVRQAMAYLFPKQAFIDKYLLSYAATLSTPWTLSKSNLQSQKLAYHPKKAAELLMAAGWRDRDQDGILDHKGIPFEFELVYPRGDKTAEQLVQFFAPLLKENGIVIRPKPLAWVRFYSRLRLKEFDSFFHTQTHPSDPYFYWNSKEGESHVSGLNYVGFKHKQADEIIMNLRKELDSLKRFAYIHQLEKIIFEEQPYLFLWNAPKHFLYRSSIRGVQFNSSFPGWRIQNWFLVEPTRKSTQRHQK